IHIWAASAPSHSRPRWHSEIGDRHKSVTSPGLAAARARGRKGGRKFALSKAQVRLAQAAMAQRDTSVSDLCKELGIERVTLYRYVGPKGELRDYGKRVLGLASKDKTISDGN
ncbi:helix-turn-helix domain-containing protein, partial [Novosphingobium sp. 63-713]